MFCAKCGKQLDPNYKFCDGCGTPIVAAANPLVAAVPEIEPENAPQPADAPIAKPVPAPAPAEVTAIPQPCPYSAPSVAYTQPAKSGGGMKIVILVIVLLAVIGGVVYWQYGSASKASSVDVAVSPAQVTVSPGAAQNLEALVTGTDDTDVTWRLQEGAVGGEISPAGASAHDGRVYNAAKYVAPGTPGVYHVIAISKADPKKAAGVTITVQ